MKKLAIIGALGLCLLGAYFLTNRSLPVDPARLPREFRDDVLERAFQNRQSDLQVEGAGTVVTILPDDTRGRRHQRFIIRLSSGQTLLVAHNIDLAPRIEALAEGDTVVFFSAYEWNAKGGVIHWTHRDPNGRHADGWILHRGRKYH